LHRGRAAAVEMMLLEWDVGGPWGGLYYALG
jgi:hypothetical protein